MILDPAKPVFSGDVIAAIERGETIVVPPGKYTVLGIAGQTTDPVATIANTPSLEPLDIWSRIHDPEFNELPSTPQSHDTSKQKGVAPIALILVGLAVIGGAIGWFAYNFLNQWLQLP